VPSVPPQTPRTSTQRTLGLPPALGLAAALMSFPAVATVAYGSLAFVLGLFLSGSSSSTTSSDGTFTTDFSEIGSGVAMVGAVGALIGLVGLYGVVMVMAGSSIGRTICTIFLVITTFLSALQLGFGSPVAAVFGIAINAYCFWALWGRPAKGIF
jgi:hypothetical protein